MLIAVIVIIAIAALLYFLARRNTTVKNWIVGIGAALVAGAVAFWNSLQHLVQ